ncbi:hypothetical protein QRX60_28585 [Amycolatopsis mongoliensis]|uniref:Uncharacterized protein n=1 Tax=Amycolatopsis mongoliensis TaxID=715475 RepID=A0A9Y2JG73_9PSEU|nr:hypothetical protein [Amycolatopsis sp. 4-36]WIX98030.1 hypothetical protein QRX60_28585 [Amycolatopsis sp. 4-36]
MFDGIVPGCAVGVFGSPPAGSGVFALAALGLVLGLGALGALLADVYLYRPCGAASTCCR